VLSDMRHGQKARGTCVTSRRQEFVKYLDNPPPPPQKAIVPAPIIGALGSRTASVLVEAALGLERPANMRTC